MPSSFQSRFAATAWPMLLAEHGRSITHCPLGCDPADGVIITAVVHIDVIGEQEQTDFYATRRMRIGRLEVPPELEVTASLEHRERDTFLIDGELWGARTARYKTTAFLTVEIERYPDPLGTPPG